MSPLAVLARTWTRSQRHRGRPWRPSAAGRL